MKVTYNVLFTNIISNYNSDHRFIPWSIEKNALNCNTDRPVICHPPCRLFGRMRQFSTAHKSEMILAFYSIGLVRKVGGIVEHPRSSLLWSSCDVGTPLCADHYGGYLISINLSWFGFEAEKKTGLYICGCDYKDLPPLPLCFNMVEKTISKSKKSGKMEIEQKRRSETPKLLIDWLFEVMQIIYAKKVNC